MSESIYGISNFRSHNTTPSFYTMSETLKQTLSVLMHHDTITGTSKQEVVNDETSKIYALVNDN